MNKMLFVRILIIIIVLTFILGSVMMAIVSFGASSDSPNTSSFGSVVSLAKL